MSIHTIYKCSIIAALSVALGCLAAHYSGLGAALFPPAGQPRPDGSASPAPQPAKTTRDAAPPETAMKAQAPAKSGEKDAALSGRAEERKKLNMAQATLRLEALRQPWAREGQKLKLYREHAEKLGLYLKYNPLPPEIKKQILDTLASASFDRNEAVLLGMAETGRARSEIDGNLAPGYINACREQLSRFVSAPEADAIIAVTENWSRTSKLRTTWEDTDELARFMNDNAAPLENTQVNQLAGLLHSTGAGTLDASVQAFMQSLLTPSQLRQFENYRDYVSLSKEGAAIHEEYLRKFDDTYRNAAAKATGRKQEQKQ